MKRRYLSCLWSVLSGTNRWPLTWVEGLGGFVISKPKGLLAETVRASTCLVIDSFCSFRSELPTQGRPTHLCSCSRQSRRANSLVARSLVFPDLPVHTKQIQPQHSFNLLVSIASANHFANHVRHALEPFGTFYPAPAFHRGVVWPEADVAGPSHLLDSVHVIDEVCYRRIFRSVPRMDVALIEVEAHHPTRGCDPTDGRVIEMVGARPVAFFSKADTTMRNHHGIASQLQRLPEGSFRHMR